MNVYILLFFWITFGLISSLIASKRDRNIYAWFILGMLFGIFGILALYLLPSKRNIAGPIPIGVNIKKDPTIKEQNFWYYLDNEKTQYGPMSFTGLKDALLEGKVSSTTYVWNDTMDEWKKFKEIPICATLLRDITN